MKLKISIILSYIINTLFFVAKYISMVGDCLPIGIAVYIIENALPQFLTFINYIYFKFHIIYLTLHKKYK